MILNSPYISGSLTVTGNTTIQGQLTVTGSLSGTASLASNALLLQGTGSTGFATTASINEVSASQQSISASLLQVSASYIALSGSYNTFSGSASTRITENSSSIQQVSSSQQQISASLLNVVANYATTGSNSFRANQSITGSLVVSSTITAQTLIVQTVTSSIVYSSGSNLFGSALGDRQTFTGSVNITGSLTVNTTGTEFQVTNNGVVMGNLLTDSHSVTGSFRVTGSLTSIGTAIFNSNALVVSSSGNVGIGVASPTYNLQVLNTIGLRANSVDFQAIKGTGFGYSPASYKVVMLGTSASSEFTTVSIGYDPAGNANASFNGSGIEVLFRRGVQFVTPNSANNNYYLTNLVLQDGNVAIGNTSPQASLHIGPSLNTVPASTSIAVTGDTAIRFMAGSDGNANYGSYIAGTQYSGVRALSLGYRQGAGDVLTMTVTQISDGIGGVGIGITNPTARLHVVGNQYIGKLGGGGNYKQTVVGQTTAAASGTSKKIAYVGFTHSVRVYVWANQSAANGSSAIADFTTLYGASTGGTTSEASFGNVSDIVVAYDNGGSPAYTINVTLTYSGAAPTINYIVEGINHDNNIYTIA